MNVVILKARLCADPELKYTTGQTAVVDLRLAWNEKYKEKEKAHFMDATAFGTAAENIQKYFTKGQEILIEARLDYQAWEKDGQKKSKHVLIINRWHFVGGKRDSDEQPDHAASSRPARRPEADLSEKQFEEESIPF